MGGSQAELSLSYSTARTPPEVLLTSESKCRRGIHGFLFSPLKSLMSKPQALYQQFLALAKRIPLLLSEEVPSEFKKKRLREKYCELCDEGLENPQAASWVPAPVACQHCPVLLYSSLRNGFFTMMAESHDHSSKVRLQSGNLGLLLSLSTEHSFYF